MNATPTLTRTSPRRDHIAATVRDLRAWSTTAAARAPERVTPGPVAA